MRVVITVLAAFLSMAATPIQNALSCGKPGSAGGLGAGTDMVRYTVNTSRFPESVCNDNQPVFNVLVSGLTFHDVVWNWWSGMQPQQAIRSFTGTAGAAPDCP